MYVRVDPRASADLRAHLSARISYVVEQVDDETLAVGVLGSYGGDQDERAIEEYLDEWRAAHPDIEVAVEAYSDGVAV